MTFIPDTDPDSVLFCGNGSFSTPLKSPHLFTKISVNFRLKWVTTVSHVLNNMILTPFCTDNPFFIALSFHHFVFFVQKHT